MGVGMPSLLRRRTSDETSVLTAEVTGMHCLYAPEMRLEQELCLADLWKRRTGAAALVLAGAQILLKSLTITCTCRNIRYVLLLGTSTFVQLTISVRY